jgi:hypothetical protein
VTSTRAPGNPRPSARWRTTPSIENGVEAVSDGAVGDADPLPHADDTHTIVTSVIVVDQHRLVLIREALRSVTIGFPLKATRKVQCACRMAMARR